jgi:hypothetical protein
MSDRPSLRPAVVAALSLAFLGALVLAGGGFGMARERQEADAYTKFIREHFIDTGRLVVNPDAGGEEAKPIVDLSAEVYEDRNSDLYLYAAQSFLLEDIRRNDPSLWIIENGRVTDISLFAHYTPPPFAGRGRWKGLVKFRSPPRRQGPDVILLEPRDQASPRLHLTAGDGAVATGDAGIVRIDLGGPGSTPAVFSDTVDLYCRRTDRLPAVKIRRIGDQVGVFADDLSRCAAEVGRARLEHAGDFEALGQGERLRLRDRGGAEIVYERRAFRPRGEVMSAPSASGDRARLPDVYWWSAAVERDFEAAFAGPERVPADDIVTSLDPDVQADVQRLLDAHLADAGGGREARIAAVTVMDALTGEVLAMATAPRASPGRSGFVDRDDDWSRAARVNQNLQLHPIGSVAKPLMAAAILKDNPDLLTLQIRGRSEAGDILGLPLTPPLSNHPAPAWVDFNAFIAGSDNIYAASLALLGSADRGGGRCALAPGDSYRLGGVELRTRPKSAFERIGRDGACLPAPTESRRQLRWPDALSGLFGVNISERGRYIVGDDEACFGGDGSMRRYGDGVHDAGPWASLLSRYATANACGFRESTPLREALALDAARDFRTQLLPVVLGNGDGVWTTVKTAEAYSRLVTGRTVRSRFTVGADSFGMIDLRRDLRSGLTHALTLVSSGTARGTALPAELDRLDAALRARNQVLGVFAKTGTPVVVSRDYRPVDKAINLLISNNRVQHAGVRDPGAVILVTPSGRIRIHPGLTPDQRARIARRLAQDRTMLEARRRFPGVSARLVVDILAGYAADQGRGGQPFALAEREGGRSLLITRVAARRSILGDERDTAPKGKVVALVVAAYDPFRQANRNHSALRLGEDGRAYDGLALPVRAYTIVVNLQYKDDNSPNGAADLAARILADALAPRLLDRRGVR